MILAPLSDSARYESLNPLFQQAFAYVASVDLSTMEPGKYEVLEDELIVMVNETVMKAPEKARMEIHHKFVDIHIPISCPERFTWKDRACLASPSEPFQQEKDAQHYDDSAETSFLVHPGHFVIFFPEDAHAGCIGEGMIHKVVIKVKSV